MNNDKNISGQGVNARLDETMTAKETKFVNIWEGLKPNIEPYKLVICDIWGVIHNGLECFPGAEEALLKLRDAGLETVFLSNAPQPRYAVRNYLDHLGLTKALQDNIVSAGGLARDFVRDTCEGQKVYHMGPGSDHRLVEGLAIDIVDTPDEAEIILASGLAFPQPEDHRDFLRGAAEKGAKFLCANPDRVVHQGDRLFYCAGAVADVYMDLGGEVEFFGKPVKGAFHACLHEVGRENEIENHEILVIGDSMQTDIAGAKNAGFDSLLIAGGIHRDHLIPAMENNSQTIDMSAIKGFPSDHFHAPNAVMRTLFW